MCFLFGILLEESNEIIPVLLLFQTTEGHLSARNVLLGIFEVGKQSLVFPSNTLLLVSIGVGVAIYGASLAAEKTVKGGADFAALPSFKSMALSATSLEEVGTLLSVTYRNTWLAH